MSPAHDDPVKDAPPAFGAGDRDRSSARARGALFIGLIVLSVAGFLRLRDLGYSEYQGDEARAVLFAVHLLETRDPGLLLWHKKGPAEVVVPAMMFSSGWTSEIAARLPFALAALAVVAAVMAIGWRLWGPAGGLTAGAVVALDGYLVAFGRIVQYQSLVLAASTAAVGLALAAWLRGGRRGDVALAILAGVAVGLGTWAHYEAVFALPPVVWLLAARSVVASGAAVAAAAVTAGLFYVPFVLHPQFASTLTYIADSRVGGAILYNNLADWFSRATFYNASYWVLALAVVLVLVLGVGLRTVGGRYGRVLVVGWLGLVAAVVVAPASFTVGAGEGAPSLAVVAFGPALALLALSRRLPVPWRAVLVWFGGPFVAAGFLVTKPHTHFYTMIPGAALLIGWGVARFVPRIATRAAWLRWSVGSFAAGLVALALVHQWVVFVRHDPEYKRVYPDARLPGVWSPMGDEMPRGGYFGFPYRAGWGAVQAWFESGDLSGSYDSNEEALITGWYTWGAPRCAVEPRYYFVAWRPQDAEEVPDDLIARGYRTWGVVTVGGREKLRVYARTVDGPVRRVAIEEASRAPALRRALPVTQALELPVAPVPPRTFADSLRLIGAETTVIPGTLPRGGSQATSVGTSAAGGLPPAATMVLTWEVVGPVGRNLSSFVHVRDAAGQTVAQSDHWPACGDATSTWTVGSLHYDAHAVPLPVAGLAPGGYELWAGLYDAENNAGLPVTSGAPDELGRDAVYVGPLAIQP